ncbi:hypothetical protein [Psychrobacter sp. 4Dc]|nr:hypothetical protein [Psychrobacter sp. 4Dc]
MSIGKDAVDRMFAKQELFDKAYQEGMTPAVKSVQLNLGDFNYAA